MASFNVSILFKTPPTVVLWCLFVVLFDGYDLALNGVALPLLMKEWGMTAVQAGMLASTALAGMMFGAMLFGMLADKIGRKKVIIICVTLFSGFTFAGGFASNPTEFGILRFIAGLGIGGVLPNLVALTSEYAPQKFALYGNLSVLDNLKFFGGAYGLSGKQLKQQIDKALLQFELKPYAKSGDLPNGFKQRLSMAAALLHQPEIVFLDEPTSGIDPGGVLKSMLTLNEAIIDVKEG